MAKKFTDEELKNYYESNPGMTYDIIAEHFGVKQPAISKRIKKLYGDKDTRSSNKFLAKDHTIQELLEHSTVSAQTQAIYIKVQPPYAEELRRKLTSQFNSKNKYHILDIIKCNNGLLVITNDLLLGEELKSMSNK